MQTMTTDPNDVDPIVIEDGPVRPRDIDAIVERVRADGFAVIRGVAADAAAFERFSNCFAIDFVRYDASRLGRGRIDGVDPSITTVNDGWAPFGWHAEGSGLPRSPECLFFHCVGSPKVGGETLFVDGARLYAALSPDVQALAARTRLVYTASFDRRKPDEVSPHLAAFRAASLDDLDAVWASMPVRSEETWDTSVVDERMTYRFSYPLVRTSPASGRDVICGFFIGQVLTDDGTPLAPALREAIVSTAYQHAYFHRWVEGDVVLVDNTRVMHARNAYNDPNRCVLVRMGNLRH